MGTVGRSTGKGELPTGNPFDGITSGIECEWYPAKPNPKVVQVVRLLVDLGRWAQSTPNEQYQRSFLRQITAFITSSLGAEAKVVVITPAGLFTVAIEQRPDYTSEAWEKLRPDLLKKAARSIAEGKVSMPVLIGLDGAVRPPPQKPSKKPHTPVQTTVWLDPGSKPDPAAMALKIHATSKEHQLLGRGINTRVIRSKRGGPQMPPALDRTLAVKHGILPLICHELIAFSGRSGYRDRRRDIEAFCDHITQVATSTRGLKFIAVASHALGPSSSGAFLNAMRKLSEKTSRTALVSAFVEAADLDAVAERFVATGDDSAKVATLLVRSKATRR